jgi:hypothetical protein
MRRFFGGVLGGWLTLTVLWVGAFYFQKGAPTKGALAMEMFRDRKQAMAQAVAGPKILLVSGSNVLLGLRAETLSRHLQQPVINAAIHAGLGIDYTLYDAKRLLRPGDTVILFFEYEQYNWDGKPSEDLLDHVVANDPAYFDQLPWREKLNYIFAIEQKRMERGLKGKFKAPQRSRESYQPEDLNAFGDFLKNREQDRPVGLAAVDKLCPALLTGIQPETQAWAKLRNFFQWAREHQIRVLASFPSLLRRSEYETPVAREVFRTVQEFYRAEGVPLVGTPGDFTYDRSLFFDSYYHLTDVGAARRTEDVWRRLAPYFNRPTIPQTRPRTVPPGA